MADHRTDDEGIALADPEAFDPDELDRPILVWDGDCDFCRRSVLWLRAEIGDCLLYAPYQQVHDRFDDFDESDFAQSVFLIEPDGTFYTGAEAAWRARAHGAHGKIGVWAYDHVPGFASLSERAYRWVADHRPLMSRWARRLFGGPSPTT